MGLRSARDTPDRADATTRYPARRPAIVAPSVRRYCRLCGHDACRGASPRFCGRRQTRARNDDGDGIALAHDARMVGHPCSVESPVATYRLQLRKDFTFDDATALVPYLAALGVSHLYLSPILQAAPGSQHGYDTVDHSQLNSELGGMDAFVRLSDAAKDAGLGIVVDIVPNHMCISGSDNAWWRDVLENGPASPWADFFYVDWHLVIRARIPPISAKALVWELLWL